MDLNSLENIKHFKFRAAVTGQVISDVLETIGPEVNRKDALKFLGIPSCVANWCLKQKQEWSYSLKNKLEDFENQM